MKKSLLCIGFLGCTSIGLLLGAAQERQEDATDARVEVFVSLDYIQVNLLVRDSEGNLIRNLSAEDFEVFENGKVQDIVALQQQEVPISAVVMADTSASLYGYLENALGTAVNFFEGLERERAAFVLFSEEPRVILDWGEEAASDVPAYLAGVRASGTTALYDSVIWVAERQFRGVSGKKLIILITDGIDTASEATFEDMMRATREAGITLYCIMHTNRLLTRYRQSLSRPDFRRPQHVSLFFHNFMLQQAQFVNQSMRFGGRTIFSLRFADLKEIYTDIIDEMKNYYVLLYSSTDFSEIEDRKIRVNTRKKPGKIFIEISQ